MGISCRGKSDRVEEELKGVELQMLRGGRGEAESEGRDGGGGSGGAEQERKAGVNNRSPNIVFCEALLGNASFFLSLSYTRVEA